MPLIVLFLLILFAFNLIYNRLKLTVVTGPMVFTILGLFVFFALPGITTPEITNPAVLFLSEITLAVVLFSDATNLDVRKVIRERDLSARLLGIGMPLTVLIGTFLAVMTVSNGDLWQAAILATILAPTDPRVASSIVKSRLVPDRIREALEIESGFNDGISLPFLLLFVALSGVDVGVGGQFPWLTYALQQTGFGVLAGLGIGLLAGWLMTRAEKPGWMVSEARQLAMLSVAILSWFIGGTLMPGNGFIAAFVAGAPFATHMAKPS